MFGKKDVYYDPSSNYEFIRKSLNGISGVLFAVGVTIYAIYALNYVSDTPKGRDIHSSVNNFVSKISQDSLENRLK